MYEYWILNDTEPAEASEVAALNIKHLKFQQGLFDKTQELRRNFVGDEFEAYSDSPELDEFKVMLNMEIVSAQDFDLDHVYVQYLLDIPEGWATGDAPQLWANSQVSRVRHVKDAEGKSTLRAVAHFGLPIEVTLWKTTEEKSEGGKENAGDKKGITRMPCILLQVRPLLPNPPPEPSSLAFCGLVHTNPSDMTCDLSYPQPRLPLRCFLDE